MTVASDLSRMMLPVAGGGRAALPCGCVAMGARATGDQRPNQPILKMDTKRVSSCAVGATSAAMRGSYLVSALFGRMCATCLVGSGQLRVTTLTDEIKSSTSNATWPTSPMSGYSLHAHSGKLNARQYGATNDAVQSNAARLTGSIEHATFGKLRIHAADLGSF